MIGSTTVTDSLIQKGSYSFIKNKRSAGKWQNANGINDENLFGPKKVTIAFSLRERSLAEHESIKGIFADQEHVSVTYWDDYDCVYRTGDFEMKAPQIQHRSVILDGINYAATPITLEEY